MTKVNTLRKKTARGEGWGRRFAYRVGADLARGNRRLDFASSSRGGVETGMATALLASGQTGIRAAQRRRPPTHASVVRGLGDSSRLRVC